MRPVMVVVLSCMALAITATAANAAYYINKRTAEHYMRIHLRDQGYRITAASCRPQGRSAPERGYIYHRWTCGWVAGHNHEYADCRGQTIVKGSSDPSTYWTKVVTKRGDGCL